MMWDTLESERRWSNGRGLLTLWTAVLLAPMAWVFHLSVSYGVATTVCPGSRVLLAATTLVALLVACFGTWTAWGVWRDVGEGSETDGSVIGRSRFMAISGLGLSGMCIIVILGQSIPPFFWLLCE